MSASDPTISRAVLIGVSEYRRMAADRQLPATAAGVARLDELLRDPKIWGLPPENCVVIQEPQDGETVVAALRQAAASTRGTLLFYYAGHGVTDSFSAGELYLALPDTYEPNGAHTALSYEFVRKEFLTATKAQQRAILLDCCWSGLALDGRAMGNEQFGTLAAVDRAAVLTACARNKMALSVPGEPFTAFTGALIELLDEGDPDGPAVFDFSYLYQTLRSRLLARGRPAPVFATTHGGENIAFARNRSAGSMSPPSHPPQAAQRTKDAVPLDGNAVAHQVAALARAGDYQAASRLQILAAGSGEPRAVQEMAREIRRRGDYVFAARLEAMVADPEVNATQVARELAAHGYVAAEVLTEEP